MKSACVRQLQAWFTDPLPTSQGDSWEEICFSNVVFAPYGPILEISVWWYLAHLDAKFEKTIATIWVEKWYTIGVAVTEWAGYAPLNLKRSMSSCLTLRSDWVPHCLCKLSSGELMQVNALSASFSPVYWYWEVNLQIFQWTLCFIYGICYHCNYFT